MRKTISAYRLLVIAACLLTGGCEGALFAALNTTNPRSDIEQHRDLVFDATHRLALDVYRPAHVEHAPVVVFFYGGSWAGGERAWYRFVGTALAAHGVVAMIPDYRKIPAVQLDGLMQDAARAVAWARDHAAQFGGDPQDLFVMGHSAGGHIAALLATDPQWLAANSLQPRDLAGFIGLAGVYTFVSDDTDDPDMQAVFGPTLASQRRAQPVWFVRGAEPPMLLLQGTADTEVNPVDSRVLEEAISAQHEEVELKLYPGVGHSGLLFAMSRPLRDDTPTLDDVLAFICAHPRPLMRAAPPAPVQAGSAGPSAGTP
jgi:acetyl esterase/lipase